MSSSSSVVPSISSISLIVSRYCFAMPASDLESAVAKLLYNLASNSLSFSSLSKVKIPLCVTWRWAQVGKRLAAPRGLRPPYRYHSPEA